MLGSRAAALDTLDSLSPLGTVNIRGPRRGVRGLRRRPGGVLARLRLARLRLTVPAPATMPVRHERNMDDVLLDEEAELRRLDDESHRAAPGGSNDVARAEDGSQRADSGEDGSTWWSCLYLPPASS